MTSTELCRDSEKTLNVSKCVGSVQVVNMVDRTCTNASMAAEMKKKQVESW